MIGIFKDIIAYEHLYYVADEYIEDGVKKIIRLSGQYKNKQDAEKRLKLILKNKKEQTK